MKSSTYVLVPNNHQWASAALQVDVMRSAQTVGHAPMGCWGKPEDVAGPVLCWASPAARYFAGVALPEDGGELFL